MVIGNKVHKKRVMRMLVLATAVVMSATLLVAFSEGSDASAGYQYYDEQGELCNYDGKIDEDTLDNENSNSITLMSGWYYMVGKGPSDFREFTITGDVYIILADGASLTSSKITVTGDSNFYVYSQSTDENVMGSLKITEGESTIFFEPGSSFTNTALIKTILLSTTSPIISGSPAMFTIGETGILISVGDSIGIDGSGTFNNKGKIISQSGNCIIINGNGTVNNYGSVTASGNDCIIINGNGTVNNFGTILVDSGHEGIVVNGNGAVINNIGNGIINSVICIDIVGDGTVVNNSGALIGKDGYSFGIYIDGNGTVINNNGTINATVGIFIKKGTTVVKNNDSIVGSDHAIYALDGTEKMILVTLVNSGLINGKVYFGNYKNDVTFAAGSSIVGNFTIGSDSNSTLYFKGVPTKNVNGEFVFSTIIGTSDLGNATVSFDIPSDYNGEVIVLIDGSVGMSTMGAPVNSSYSPDDYYFTISVRNTIQLIAWSDTLQYVNVEGELKTYFGLYTVINSTNYIFGQNLTLSDGWYYVTVNVTFTQLMISGDVSIIISNGLKIISSKITVTQDSNLYVYSQSTDENIMGILELSFGSGSLTFEGGSSITNTAFFNIMRSSQCIIGSPKTITNGVTGTIQTVVSAINVNSACTVNNYGKISGTDTIRFYGNGSVINNSGEIIGGGNSAILISGGDVVINNRGTIESGPYGIYVNGDCTVNNYGTIAASSSCITITAGTTVLNNFDTITGSVGIYVYNIDPEKIISFTLVNIGTINGSVVLDNYNNDVTLVAGSSINGGFYIGTDSTLYFKGDPEKNANGEFVFSTITGISDIGNATVSFDIPVPYNGEVIILIDGSQGDGYITEPFNTTYTTDDYHFIKSIRDDQQLITGSGYQYIDVDGELKTHYGEIDVTSFKFPNRPTMLTSGWYYVPDAGGLNFGTITISGDVYIIIADGAAINSNLITVTQGSNLYVYAQSTDEGQMGTMAIPFGGNTITFEAGSSFTNTALITKMGSSLLITGSPAAITNGITGIIRHGGAPISVSSACTIENNGFISGGEPIYISGGGTVVNNYGLIYGIRNGIYIDGDGTVVNNHGTINSGECAIYIVKGTAVVNNYNTINTGFGTGIQVSNDIPENIIPVILVNSGTINGNVILGNYKNDVTFVAGSIIDGNFTIGTDSNSTLSFIGDPEKNANSEFVFSAVTGTSDIGNATVSFDLPAAYNGEVIVLIDGSQGEGNITTPINTTYLADDFYFIISIRDNQQLIASSGIDYIDVDGELKTYYGEVDYDTLDSAHVPSTLYSGWYFTTGKGSLTLAEITISGNVHIIFANNASIYASKITVQSGSNLYTYAQTKDPEEMGGVSISLGDRTILLEEGSSLTNTALIQIGHWSSDSCITASSATITNGVTGIIQGGVKAITASSDCTVKNYGLIHGMTYGIYFEMGGTVYNHGTITTDFSEGSAIYTNGNVTVYNHGTISCPGGSGIYIDGGSAVVNNHGTITSDNYPGIGISIAAGTVEVNNYGTISGIDFGIYVSDDSELTIPLTLVNRGTIHGHVILANAANDVTLFKDSVIYGNFSIGKSASKLHFAVDEQDTLLSSNMIFSTVTGDVDIGDGTTEVTFDIGAIPAGSEKDTVILIDGGGIASTKPADPATENEYIIYIEGGDLLAGFAYTITYDVNGGDTGTGPETESVVNGTYPVAAGIPTHADENGLAVVFIGWTSEPDSTIYAKGGIAPATITSVNIADSDVTVYAVWGYDTNGSGKADVTETWHSIIYVDNGGTDGPGTQSVTDGTYPVAAGIPTYANEGGPAIIFIGWSGTQVVILEKDGTVPTLVTGYVTVNGGNVTLYAVWGYDTNGSGEADVTEPKYSIEYDVNGGEAGSGPQAETGLISGGHPLLDAPKPTHPGVDSKDVVFIGWTSEPDSTIYVKGGIAPATITSVNIVDSDVTVYAVWGYDTNGSGEADVTETWHSIIYDDNGGTGGPETQSVVDGTYTLSGIIPTYANGSGPAIIFIGWTLDDSIIGPVLGKDGTVPALVTGDVTVSGGNVTLYAVWGYDTNNSGTPDVTDTKYTVTYDVNGGNDNGPADDTLLLAGVHVLSGTKPTYGTDGSIVFIGWTETRDTKTYAKGETPPTTITSVNIVDSDVTVYAVWGYDTTGDGQPDVNKVWYTVTYDANGGNGAPEAESVVGGEYTISDVIPTHPDVGKDKVIFIGWTFDESIIDVILDKSGTVPTIETSLIVNGNIKLYAVWGYDTTGDGQPDVNKVWYTVTYDANGGNGAPEAESVVGGEYMISGIIPTHPGVGGKDIIFIGWTLDDSIIDDILDRTGTVPTIETSFIVNGDVKLYAVWGIDTNNNGEADVTEPKYTVEYNVNGGVAGSGPQAETGLISGGHPLLDAPRPTHIADSIGKIVFIGWTSVQDGTIFAKGGTAPTTITSVNIADSDVTVYAVWGYDTTGDGEPDVNKDWYTIIYNINGGNAATLPENGILLLPGEHDLSGTKPTYGTDGSIVFIGWTSVQDSTIYAKGGTPPTTITSVNIADSDVTVYAVWGYDTNGSGEADVTETWHSIIYDDNGGTGGPGTQSVVDGTYQILIVIPTHGTDKGFAVIFIGWTLDDSIIGDILGKTGILPDLVTGTVTVNGVDVELYAVWGYDTNNSGTPDVTDTKYSVTYDVNGGDEGSGPLWETGLINGEHPLKDMPKPTHPRVDGKDVVFIGWTSERDTQIYAKGGVPPETITSVDILDEIVFVYAVWGYDTTGDGEPDVSKEWYTIKYDINGGDVATLPEGILMLPGEYGLSSVRPSHSDGRIVFIGWTDTRDTNIYAKGETPPQTIDKAIIVDSDVTVYAVWGYDTTGDGQPDVNKDWYTIHYDVNGGNKDGPEQQTVIAGEYPIAPEKPTHADDGVFAVVFIGWTLDVNNIGKILEKGDTVPELEKDYITVNGDVTLYAVWGIVTNSTGEPDATVDWYTITYNANGGEGAPDAESVVNGTYPIADGKPTHPGADGKDVVFIGWSETQVVILAKNGTLPLMVEDNVTVNGKSVTLYAVWGYDTIGDGEPDVGKDWYTVTYNANGGEGAPDAESVVGGEYTVSGVIPIYANGGGPAIIFIGWTLDDSIIGDILSKDGTVPALVTNFIISGSVTLYAVWGIDSNGSGIPDVNETWYTVEYNDNGGTGGPGTQTVTNGTYPFADGEPTHLDVGGKSVIFIGWTLDPAVLGKIFDRTGTLPAIESGITVDGAGFMLYAVWGIDTNNSGTPDVTDTKYTVEYDVTTGTAGSGPQTETDLISGQHPLLNTPKPTHPGADGKDVVFIGWTSVPDSTIYAKGDALPTTITSVDIVNANVTVYAVWGYDTNNNGIADVEEAWYSIIYNDNGGTGGPGVQSVVNGTYPIAAGKPTHADDNDFAVIFIGWTLDSAVLNAILAKNETVPTLVTNVTVNGVSITLYAVWGYDTNGTGIPDVSETWHTITYDANGGTGAPDAEKDLVAGTYNLVRGEQTHEQMNGHDVLFLGWSLTKAGVLVSGDKVPALITMVTIANADVTVYAVWGIDTTGSGIPDVLEPSEQPDVIYIIATAGEGSTISPSGTIAVTPGSDRTFTFTAEPGYRISAVYVDGTPISDADLVSGKFTLRNIQSGHSIEVVTAPAETIILTVEIVGGDGTAKYRIGPSGEYVSFTGPQRAPLHADLYILIDVGSGYTFAGWTGYVVSNDTELHFTSIDGDVTLTAHVKPNDGGYIGGGTGNGSGGEREGGWSILSLIFAAFAIFTGAAAVIAGWGRRRKEEGDGNGQGRARSKTAILLRTLALVIGIATVIVFFITEDLSMSASISDKWTLLMILMFIMTLIPAAVSFRYDEQEGEQGMTETEAETES